MRGREFLDTAAAFVQPILFVEYLPVGLLSLD